mmetsp:Transcript_64243/g.147928  ORF Transcript_64243/g.147928 Transcript_64243/m.147928 type:complete len:244 (-) Transcript_64243:174-905(-)
MFSRVPDDSDASEFSSDGGWIAWFSSLKGHEFLAEVDEEYIRDSFNLYGLRPRVTHYDNALEMILSDDAPDHSDLEDRHFQEVYRDAVNLYGLIHARYIVSPRGLQVMREKYMKSVFGFCPRVLCDRQHVLPVGVSDDLCVGRVKVYCAKCELQYTVRSKYADIDGSFFGTSFPHIYMLTYPTQLPLDPPRPFVPRIFGFKIHRHKGVITRKREKEREEEATRAKVQAVAEGPFADRPPRVMV